MKMTKKGFTLIELMIVVAIIGILAAIAIPKFADLINKSKEGSTKGGLSSVRSALQVYYGDNEGWFPTEAGGLTCIMPKYINSVPVAKLPSTGLVDSNAIKNTPNNAGGWFYENRVSSPTVWGDFRVDATACDLKGQALGGACPATSMWSTF